MNVGDQTGKRRRVSRIRTISLQLQRTAEDVKLLRGHRRIRVRKLPTGSVGTVMTMAIVLKMRSLAGMATQTSLSARQR
jgi:hypothetical protein